MIKILKTISYLTVLGALIFADPAWAAETKPKLDSGDTAWLLTSTAIVLLMTIPGVALFYAGMARKKNVLSVLMQSFTITCLISIIWMFIDDNDDAFKGYQKDFRKLEIVYAEKKLESALAEVEAERSIYEDKYEVQLSAFDTKAK